MSIDDREPGQDQPALVPAEQPELPRRARRHAHRLTFLKRLEPLAEAAEDLDTARLVIRFQAGEREEAFSILYARYFERIYAYLRLLLRDEHEAEDATQQAFVQALHALPNFELRPGRPVRVWLYRIARNCGLMALRGGERLTLADPGELERLGEESALAGGNLSALGWTTDSDLVLFAERLPLAQRQVIALRFMFDLSLAETARILDRTVNDVSVIQHRAVAYLRKRLIAVAEKAERADQTGAEQIQAAAITPQALVARKRRFALLKR